MTIVANTLCWTVFPLLLIESLSMVQSITPSTTTPSDASAHSVASSVVTYTSNLAKGALLTILLAAAIIRYLAAQGDLALDEIWSLDFVRNHLRHFLGVFAFRHDNNHLLNTMILAMLGPDLPGLWYRIPAVIASIASVWLAGRIVGLSQGKAGAIFASLITGGSYLLILYGSEARGYAYGVLFAYLSWWSLLRLVEKGNRVDAIIFACSSCLGLLAHLTFVYCYAGFCLYSIWRFIQRPRWCLVLAHIPPLFVALALLLLFVPGMGIGGGNPTSPFAAIMTTLSMIAGGPISDDGALVMALIVALVLFYSLLLLWLSDAATALCMWTTIIIAPAAVLLLTGHSIVYPRYFLIPIAFALLLVSDRFAYWWRSGGFNRAIVVLLLIVAGIGNSAWTASLLDHGRGNYSATLQWMAQRSQNQSATIGSDHDFRNGMVIGYYLNRLWPGDPPLRYVPLPQFPPQGTDWLIRHNFEGDPPFDRQQIDPFGNRYQLERIDQNRSLTGWNWWIFRRQKP